LQPVLAPRDQDQVASVRGGELCQLEANTARRARDQGCLLSHASSLKLPDPDHDPERWVSGLSRRPAQPAGDSAGLLPALTQPADEVRNRWLATFSPSSNIAPPDHSRRGG